MTNRRGHLTEKPTAGTPRAFAALLVACVALSGFGSADQVELLPQLAEKPYVFASGPNAFAGKPDCKSVTFPLKGGELPDFGKAAAIVLTVRASDANTRAIEIGLHDAKGGVWGSTSLPIRRDWSDVMLPFEEMRYFSHWRLPPVSSDALPEAKLFTSLHFCFGKWLCANTLAQPHGFEVKSVRLVRLSAAEMCEPSDHSLDEFEAKPGESDDTARFQRAIRACRGHVLSVPAGTYRVSSTLYVENSASIRLNKSATVVAVKEMPFVFDLSGQGGGRLARHDYNRFFIGGRIDGAGLASCVRVSGYAHFTMRDTTFLNGKLYGLRVDGGYEVMANNLYFKCVIPGLAGNSALYINGGDSHYTDCIAVDYTIGVNEVRGGSNRFTRCHVWGGPLPAVKPGEDREMLKNSVCYRICGGSTILRDCYADTGKTGFELRGWETRLLGCSYFNNKVFKLDNVTIIRQSAGGRALVSECAFCKNMPHTKVYEGTGSIEWHNMLYSGFSAEDDCPGALTFGKPSGKDQKAPDLAAASRARTTARIAEIEATPNLALPAGARAFYVSPDGDDRRDGLSPAAAWRTVAHVSRARLRPGDYVLFRRGGTWRVGLDLPGYDANRPFLGYAGGLKAQKGVTYSAYGQGPKPRFIASPFDGADPARWRATDAPGVWACELGRTDVGNVVFDGGARHAIKIVPHTHDDGSVTAQYTGRPFRSYRDLEGDLHFYHDWSTNGIGRGTGTLYLRSRENPGARFKSIEFGVRHNIITAHGQPGVTIDNLALAHGGAHGIHQGGSRDLTVKNCTFAWIGGGVQGENLFGRPWPVRYGNAVEVGDCDGYVVSNCYVREIYDAGLTHQAGVVSRWDKSERTVYQRRIRYVDNVIERCNYSIEYFLSSCPATNPSTMDDFVIAGNQMWQAGRGLCEQRPDRNQDAHVKSWSHSNRARGYVIRDNLFADANCQFVEVLSCLTNADGAASLPRVERNVFLVTDRPPQRFGAIEQVAREHARPADWPMDAAKAERRLAALGAGNRVVVAPREKGSR